jgi:transcription elongation factor GreA
MAQFTYLTQAGYDKLKADLEEMRTTGRKEAAKAIAEAREKGDLSENAEYDAAKEHQGLLEAKINGMEQKLGGARIIDETMLDTSKVGILTTVTIKNIKTNKIFVYKLVPELESDLKQNKISAGSPVGQGLLGKVEGEIALVRTPNGNIELKVLKITIEP